MNTKQLNFPMNFPYHSCQIDLLDFRESSCCMPEQWFFTLCCWKKSVNSNVSFCTWLCVAFWSLSSKDKKERKEWKSCELIGSLLVLFTWKSLAIFMKNKTYLKLVVLMMVVHSQLSVMEIDGWMKTKMRIQNQTKTQLSSRFNHQF